MNSRMLFVALVLSIVCLNGVASAQASRRRPAADGTVNLPHTVTAGGQQWVIQRGGWLQQQGNVPLFAQGANLMLNGAGPQGNANRAAIDQQTGEIIVEGLQIGGYPLTRRILINGDENYVRYIDIFKGRAGGGGGGGGETVPVLLQTSLNFGVNGGVVVNDPKTPAKSIAWIAPTGAGAVVVEVWAGKNSKVTPEVNWQPGNSFVQATYQLSIPAGGQVAIMHLHAITGGNEEGEKFVNGLREAKLLAGVPADVRKAIVNFRGGSSFLGEREILRGDSLDVIELRSGDTLRGTLLAKSFAIATAFGRIELPAEKIVGVLNAGSFRPRQLLITVDGEIVGGTIEGDAIAIQLSSGQTTNVPVSQIARVGYRRRGGEPEELLVQRPMIWLRSGDRLAIEPLTEPLSVLTRFGSVAIPPAQLASADLRSTDAAVHVLSLIDGSRFAGLLQASELTLKLTATAQPVTLPLGQIGVLQLVAGDAPEAAEESPRLTLIGDDVLCAALSGTIELQTLFDTLTINVNEITALAPVAETEDKDGGETGGDVKVTLWDGTTISGQMREPVLHVTLAGDMKLAVPLPLVREYEQPNPRPSEDMAKRIRAIVDDLNADDFTRREQAQAELVALGQVVVPLLKEWRTTQPLEAQQRIDAVLKKLSE